MNRHDIIDGLKESLGLDTDPGLQRTEHCLEPAELAAFLDGDSGNRAFNAHLADCPFCLQQLARICRSQDDEAATSVPPELLLQAEALGPKPSDTGPPDNKPVRHRPWFGRMPVAAAMAATVVLAVGVLLFNFDTVTSPGAKPAEFPTTRYADTGAMNPRLLAPTAGSLIVPAEQVFHWTEVPGSLFYDVRLVDPEGELLLRERVEATRWLIPESLALHAGGEYYVRVDAYLDDERFLSSEHVVFSVRSDP